MFKPQARSGGHGAGSKAERGKREATGDEQDWRGRGLDGIKARNAHSSRAKPLYPTRSAAVVAARGTSLDGARLSPEALAKLNFARRRDGIDYQSR